MNKGQMGGAWLPVGLVRDQKLVEEVEQTDRSGTVCRLLAETVHEWKFEYYARQYGDGELALARAAPDAGVFLWEMVEYARASKVRYCFTFVDFGQGSCWQRWTRCTECHQPGRYRMPWHLEKPAR